MLIVSTGFPAFGQEIGSVNTTSREINVPGDGTFFTKSGQGGEGFMAQFTSIKPVSISVAAAVKADGPNHGHARTGRVAI